MANTLEDFARAYLSAADPGTQNWLANFQQRLAASGPTYSAMDRWYTDPNFNRQWPTPPASTAAPVTVAPVAVPVPLGPAPTVGVETSGTPGGYTPADFYGGHAPSTQRQPAEGGAASYPKIHGGTAQRGSGGRAMTQADEARVSDPGAYRLYQRLRDSDVQTWLAAAMAARSGNAPGAAFDFGTVKYDPTADTSRHWWGQNKSRSNREAKGYSGFQRIINFYNDAIVRGWDPRSALAQALARANRVTQGGAADKRGERWGLTFTGF